MDSQQMESRVGNLSQDVAIIKAKFESIEEDMSSFKHLPVLTAQLQGSIENLTAEIRTNNERITKSMEMTNERIIKEHESVNDRLTRHGERIGKTEKGGETNALLIEKMAARLDSLESDVKEIKMKPSKRWDGMVEKVVCVVVGAIAMFLLYQLGLG